VRAIERKLKSQREFLWLFIRLSRWETLVLANTKVPCGGWLLLSRIFIHQRRLPLLPLVGITSHTLSLGEGGNSRWLSLGSGLPR
ncbi:MAG: hypothetical protein WC125_09470, partial [Bacteroidales bacterium]